MNNIPQNLLLKNQWLSDLMYAAATGEQITNEALQGYRHHLVYHQVLPLYMRYKERIRQAMGIELSK